MFILKNLYIPFKIQDKIFEIRYDSNDSVSKIISYFPLSELEHQTLLSILKQSNFSGFHSIFTDIVTDDEWNKTKDQIKNRFQNELFDIDSKL
jgi:lipoate-protein ligase A